MKAQNIKVEASNWEAEAEAEAEEAQENRVVQAATTIPRSKV